MAMRRWLDWRYWKDFVVAADPGLRRLIMATRATLIAGLALLVLAVFSSCFGHPVRIAIIGVAIGMMGAVAVQDQTVAAQRLTTVLLGVPALVLVAFGSAVAPHIILASLAFVAVIFLAVWARRFGPRGSALGLIGFFSFLYALFFHANLAQFPWIAACIVIALACNLLIRFVVFRDRPKLTLRWILFAFLARARLCLRLLADAAASNQWKSNRRSLVQNAAMLNETALDLETTLQDENVAALADISPTELRTAIFAVELLVERIINTVRKILAAGVAPQLQQPISQALLATYRLVGKPPRRRDASDEDRVKCLEDLAHEIQHLLLHDLAVLLQDLLKASRSLFLPTPKGSRGPKTSPAPGPKTISGPPPLPSSAQGRLGHYLSLTTRQALQSALAGGVAIIAGYWLSASRWYWAVIAAYVIFIRTTSRGETLVKGWHRLVGTMVGIAAGIGVASLARGNQDLQLGLIFLFIFLGYYLFQISYGWLVGSITAVLALLYEMLGMLTVPVLYLRLEETLIGVAAGALVALLVFPIGTLPVVKEQLLQVLQELAGYLEKVGAQLGGQCQECAAAAAVRPLDASLQDLLNAARPLMGRIMARTNPKLAHRLLLMHALVFQARNLAPVVQSADSQLDGPGIALVQQAVSVLSKNFLELRASLEQGLPAAKLQGTGELLQSAAAALSGPAQEQARAAHRQSAGAILLETLQALDEIGQELGNSFGGSAW